MQVDGSSACIRARAGVNIALIKYWGKRDAALNVPATGSLSLTLAEIGTETRVRFAPDAGDRVLVDGKPADEPFARRVLTFVDLVREQAGMRLPCEIATANTVPTAAGLASSASGFAALALAATRAAGLRLAPEALSALARRGSGSAARSIFGGFVEMRPGVRADGSDAHACVVLAPEAWDLRLVIAVTEAGPKALGSTEAMERTARTSPYYPAWLDVVETDLEEARTAVVARDLGRLGPVMERNALRMHACAMAADPPILYWTGATVEAIRAVIALRTNNTEAYFTMDAGPHVKVLCRAADVTTVEVTLRAQPGVSRTIVASPGPGVSLT
jgi:diphosphomevalonate decarboxylase